MLVQLDKQKAILYVVLGVNESYSGNPDLKSCHEKLEALKVKMAEFQAEHVAPVLKEVEETVLRINKSLNDISDVKKEEAK